MSEEVVLNYLRDTNRPWNITNVTARRPFPLRALALALRVRVR